MNSLVALDGNRSNITSTAASSLSRSLAVASASLPRRRRHRARREGVTREAVPQTDATAPPTSYPAR
jgi:hypothetical protein